MFDNRALGRQIALEHSDRSICADGLIVRVDDILPGQGQAALLIGLIQPLLAAVIKTASPQFI